MILREETPDVVVSGNFQETTFSMDDQNQHIIFDILRSKVYKNNIGAICREVASNARDAQREIGDFSNPIEIEISDKRKSFLYEDGLNIIFRDRGVGISPERVANIYTKYGASTKRNTNTQTGGFGLGAKTPFSYSDAFTVRTIVDNVEYVYSIYIDPSKIGKMALLFQEDVEHEGNKTEIIIPIKEQDLLRFENEVLRNTFFWEARPKLINFKTSYPVLESPTTTTKFPYERKGDYRIYKKTQFLESHINVIIDGIYYPVDMKILGLDFQNSNFAMCLVYNNGDLNISANRETLQYDDTTIKIIRDKVKGLFEELKATYESTILQQPNVFLAQVIYNQFYSNDELFKVACKNNPMYYDLPLKNGETVPVKHTLSNNYAYHPETSYVYVMYKDANGRATKQHISNIFCKDFQNSTQNMFWINQKNSTDKKGRLSVGINRAIFTATKNQNFILIVEKPLDAMSYGSMNQAAFDLKLENDKTKLMTDFGFQFQDYWAVTPEKYQGVRKKKETVVIKTFQHGNYDRSAEYKFDEYFLDNEGEQDTNIVEFYVEEERSFSPDIKNYLEDISNVMKHIDPAMKILISTKLKKKKYFQNYTTLEDYIEKNAVEVKKIYERYKLDSQIMTAENYKDLKLEQSIQDDLDYLYDLKKLKSIKLYNILAFFKNKMPKFDVSIRDFSATFDKIKKNYPLIESMDSDAVKHYVKLVNDLEYYKGLASQI